MQQDRISVVPQVSGQIASVDVAENQAVRPARRLFTIDPAVYHSAVEEDQAKLESARLEVEKLKAAYAQARPRRRPRAMRSPPPRPRTIGSRRC